VKHANKRQINVTPPDAVDKVFLTERQLATRHRRSVKTLRNARVYGGYIPFIKTGRSVRYRLDVLACERNNLLRSTSDGQNVEA